MNGNVYDTDGKSPALTTKKDPAIKYEQSARVYAQEGKSPTLLAGHGGVTDKIPKLAINEIHYRKLTVLECERLQTVPEGYTKGVSKSQAYKMLGNGWTVDVIAHILSFLPGGNHDKQEGRR